MIPNIFPLDRVCRYKVIWIVYHFHQLSLSLLRLGNQIHQSTFPGHYHALQPQISSQPIHHHLAANNLAAVRQLQHPVNWCMHSLFPLTNVFQALVQGLITCPKTLQNPHQSEPGQVVVEFHVGEVYKIFQGGMTVVRSCLKNT